MLLEISVEKAVAPPYSIEFALQYMHAYTLHVCVELLIIGTLDPTFLQQYSLWVE